MKKLFLLFSIFLISIIFTACSSGMNETSNKMMEKNDSKMSEHQMRVNSILNGGSGDSSSSGGSSSGGSSGGHK